MLVILAVIMVLLHLAGGFTVSAEVTDAINARPDVRFDMHQLLFEIVGSARLLSVQVPEEVKCLTQQPCAALVMKLDSIERR